MADTRVGFALGKPVPGFTAGQGLLNQVKQTTFKAGEFSWKLHATAHKISTVGSGAKAVRKVQGFHVSLYSDGKNWGQFVWEYTPTGDKYAFKEYTGTNKSQLGTTADHATLVGKANAIAAALKSTFGGSSMGTASW